MIQIHTPVQLTLRVSKRSYRRSKSKLASRDNPSEFRSGACPPLRLRTNLKTNLNYVNRSRISNVIVLPGRPLGGYQVTLQVTLLTVCHSAKEAVLNDRQLSILILYRRFPRLSEIKN